MPDVQVNEEYEWAAIEDSWRRDEQDLRDYVERNVSDPDDELRWRCEQTIRNHDPCISCATHFLKLKVVRE